MASKDGLIKVGPPDIGYPRNPQNFEFKGRNEISQIFVSSGENGITSIQFQYVENGEYVLSNRYGYGSNTNKFHTIELNHPAEYITGVSGLYYDSDKVRVISFTTNIKEYGPFGEIVPKGSKPKSFTFNLGNSCQFGGFHGTYSSWGLISIGLYLSPKTAQPSLASKIPKNEA